MRRETLEEGLCVFRCAETGGIFVPAGAYWRWLHKQPDRLPQLPAPSSDQPVEGEPPSARVCPETGTLMGRYRVGHGFRSTVDRSVSGSIWLDAGEWEALRARQFHDELHLVFTAPWQRDLREQDTDRAERLRLEERLGSDLLERLASLRDELSDHPHRILAMAFLNQPAEAKSEEASG